MADISTYHTTVLLNEALAALQVVKNGWYMDCTLGDGGHTLAILQTGGKVLAVDHDPQAITRSRERLLAAGFKEDQDFWLQQGNFKNPEELYREAQTRGFGNSGIKASGIIYDLGTSFLQLEEEARGFSFDSQEPLDMRMDPSLSVSAQDLVNALPEKQLAEILLEYGGEHRAYAIARAIVKARKEKPIVTGKDLAEIISRISPRAGQRIHPATRSFQALRIAVNDEIENLEFSLPRAAELLLPGGRLVIISFHSLEDAAALHLRPYLKELTEKPITPSQEEVEVNPRARSAKMRIFEK